MKTIGTANPLEHADLAVPPLHIPDGNGGCYKTELVIERSEDRVVKIQWWHAPDPRRDPHNHPWEFFRSTILDGGYTETRYWIAVDGNNMTYVASGSMTYRAGDVNVMPHDVYHTVDRVLPNTVTRMETGPLRDGGDWGYLMDEEHVKAEPDPEFFGQLCAINPHKRLPLPSEAPTG